MEDQRGRRTRAGESKGVSPAPVVGARVFQLVKSLLVACN